MPAIHACPTTLTRLCSCNRSSVRLCLEEAWATADTIGFTSSWEDFSEGQIGTREIQAFNRRERPRVAQRTRISRPLRPVFRSALDGNHTAPLLCWHTVIIRGFYVRT